MTVTLKPLDPDKQYCDGNGLCLKRAASPDPSPMTGQLSPEVEALIEIVSARAEMRVSDYFEPHDDQIVTIRRGDLRQAATMLRLASANARGGREYWKARYQPDMTEREKETLAREMCSDPSIRAPVQGFAGGIPWEMHMRAYEVYCAKYRGQVAIIDLFGRGCRGGFGAAELDAFIPGWRDELSERTALLAKIASLEAALASTSIAGDEVGRMAQGWHPIAELADLYQQPIWIASPKLIHGDSNTLGIAEAYWQDTTGPEEGEWRTTSFDMCNDEWNTISLAKGDVTHFLIPTGPWSADELEALEWGDSEPSAITAMSTSNPAGKGSPE